MQVEDYNLALNYKSGTGDSYRRHKTVNLLEYALYRNSDRLRIIHKVVWGPDLDYR